MFRPTLLPWIALSLIVVPFCLAATSTEKIRNQKVVVTEEALKPGETASLPGNRPDLLVILTGDTAELIPGHGKAREQSVKRGDTLFQAAGAESIKNNGTSTLSFARIVFLTGGNEETWGMSGLSPNYKLILENRYVRAYDIKIPAQSFEPRHTHHDRVVICLSGAKLEHILPDGEKQPSTLKTGETVWRPGATHVGHNIGQTDLWVIAVEPK
jgi:quercetin dioxygenase-like cupin family protein